MLSREAAQRIRPVRDALLDLHRALLETERLAWQRLNGRNVNHAELLQLAIHDPWFGWLRPLTVLVVAIDDALADKTPDSEAEVVPLLTAARELLRPNEEGSDFQQRYYEFVQRSPDVTVSHGHAMKRLEAALPNPPTTPPSGSGRDP